MEKTTLVVSKLVGQDVIEKFTRVFDKTSVGFCVIEHILTLEEGFWQSLLTDMNASDALIRQAQGGKEAVRRIQTVLKELVSMEIRKEILNSEIEPASEEEDDGKEYDFVY